jgi:hypothetical protein
MLKTYCDILATKTRNREMLWGKEGETEMKGGRMFV